MVSIDQKMGLANNRPAGFDYMRLALSSAVILSHSFQVIANDLHRIAVWSGPDKAVVGLILPMFFALSGFLVTGSLERNKTLVSFLGLRILRLFPALTVELILSAFVLGLIFTVFPSGKYFHSHLFREYFWNLVGHPHFELPGVFLHNPSGDTVNSQLWTIPFEMKCYIALAVLAVVGIACRPKWLLGGLVMAQAAFLVQLALRPPAVYNIAFPGEVLVGCFLGGVLLFKFRDKIPLTLTLFIISTVTSMSLLLIPYGYYALSLPAAYMTVYLGTLNFRRDPFLLSGDYSYGLYLYGFPLQQAFVALGPWTYHWWLNFFCVYPVAFGFAALSWWLVEKPILGLKRYVYKIETWALLAPPLAWHSRFVFMPVAAAVPRLAPQPVG